MIKGPIFEARNHPLWGHPLLIYTRFAGDWVVGVPDETLLSGADTAR